MGWGLKIGLFFVALIAADFGALIITIPILAFLFLPPILNRGGGGKRGRKEQSDKGRGYSLASVAGWLLVLLSGVAFVSGGSLSPIVFAVLGFALVFRSRLSLPASTSLAPVSASILMRHTLAPYRWTALAEAKISTRDLEGALSGVSERLFFTSDPKPRVFLVFSTSSFGRGKAEETLTKRIQTTARSLVPLGVYLLPLDSAEAADIATIHASRAEPPTENLRQHISTSDYGSLIVESRHGFVEKFDLYARSDPESKGNSILSPLKTLNTGQLTLRELLHEARNGLGAPHPDRYGAFLSSMAATEGEALGQRITETVESGQGQVLLVASVGNPPVELSRAQLQAVSRIYE
jgi:hypothetical protein